MGFRLRRPHPTPRYRYYSQKLRYVTGTFARKPTYRLSCQAAVHARELIIIIAIHDVVLQYSMGKHSKQASGIDWSIRCIIATHNVVFNRKAASGIIGAFDVFHDVAFNRKAAAGQWD